MGSLRARYATGSFTAGLELVTAITEKAEAANHHPDVDLRYPSVDIRLVSHDVGAVTERDVALAKEISALAAAAGVPAQPDDLRVVELALDTSRREELVPFWRTVLGLSESNGELVDPAGRLSTLWFQTSEERTGRGRFHLDVYVPDDQAENRVREATEAGGTLVSDEFAPAWWVLADADGNEACICTWHDSGQRP